MTARAGGAIDSAARARFRKNLRKKMRAARRALADERRRAAQSELLRRIRALPAFRASSRIATFVAFDGEPDLSALSAISAKSFFVPILRGDTMRFARLAQHTQCVRNAFGIVEPAAPEYIDRRELDLVLTPLVAFDDRGIRLGVGGGYYDRCFAYLRARATWLRPKLLGVAFSFQHVPRIDREDWDVPLWGVVTDAGAQVFRQASQ